MSATAPRPGALAYALWLLEVLVVALAVVLSIVATAAGHNMFGDPTNVVSAAFLMAILLTVGTFGMLILRRQPDNAIGWVFSITALILALSFPLGVYADYGLSATHPLPGAALAAWYDNTTQGPAAFTPIIFLILLFPNGRPLSPRWRPVVWLAIFVTVATTLVAALTPGPLSNYSSVVNPVGLNLPKSIFGAGLGATFILELALVVAGAVSFILRFRRSRGEERLQLKWFASAVVFLAVVILSGPILWQLPNPIWPIALLAGVTAVLVSIGTAMLKYQLYEIDLIINRALVYGSLTITLAGGYVLGVIGVQALLRTITGQSSELAVAVVTLAIAALFNPWRHRLQRFIDRRFYRRKYDAARILAHFQTRLRDEVDLEQLSDDLTLVIQETVQPAAIALWLPGADTQ